MEEKALQECNLNDFSMENNLSYECVVRIMFPSGRGRVLISWESEASKREKEALQKCKLEPTQEREAIGANDGHSHGSAESKAGIVVDDSKITE